jgi:hypothetical protein
VDLVGDGRQPRTAFSFASIRCLPRRKPGEGGCIRGSGVLLVRSEHEFAEVFSSSEVAKRVRGFAPGKHCVNHRVQLMVHQEGVHFFERLSAPNR